MIPRWITWDENGGCMIWSRKPIYVMVTPSCGDPFGMWTERTRSGGEGVFIDADEFRRKRGGPKAIKRIRLEEVT